MSSKLAVLGTAVMALAVSACVPPVEPTDMRSARARWEAAGLTDYRFDFQRACFCAAEVVQPVTIEVRGGRVDRVISQETGSDIAGMADVAWPTVADLFGIIVEARRAGITPLETEYDAQLGYPLRIVVGELANDAGTAYIVASLERLSP